jgi:hypothetical protein
MNNVKILFYCMSTGKGRDDGMARGRARGRVRERERERERERKREICLHFAKSNNAL